MVLDPYVELPAGILDGQLGTSRDIQDWLNAQKAMSVSKTRAETHLYADGDNGSDSNDGRTASTPKKTIQAVFDLIPIVIDHNVAVHLSGTFANEDMDAALFVIMPIATTVRLIIDGGPGVTVIDDNGESNYTATSSSTSSITDSSASWTPDEHSGYWIEILTGPAAGQLRLIAQHDGTSITPMRNWSIDPGVGATFRIVRPTTQLSGTTGSVRRWSINSVGPGEVHIQRLHITGNKPILEPSCQELRIDGVVSDSSNTNCFFDSGCARIMYGYFQYDPHTFAIRSAASEPYLGVSQRHASSRIHSLSGGVTMLRGVYAREVSIETTKEFQALLGGPRINPSGADPGLTLTSCGKQSGSNSIDATSGWFSPLIGGGTGVGIQLKNSQILLGTCECSDNGSHGIEVISSILEMAKAVAGTGNTGAGVRAHAGSVVLIKNGTPPTITGTVGDLSFDGTTQASTWAAIDAGAPQANAAEVSMCKEQ